MKALKITDTVQLSILFKTNKTYTIIHYIIKIKVMQNRLILTNNYTIFNRVGAGQLSL